MTTQTEITAKNHRRAVRYFWGVLIGATLVSLVGNITHAVLPYIPHVVVQIGAAAVPPIALLAAVHGPLFCHLSCPTTNPRLRLVTYP
jgi:hypothetical protein